MPCRNWGKWRYSPTILDFGTRLRRVVSFTTRPLYSQGKSTRCPLDRRQIGPQIRFGLYGEENNLLTRSGNESRSSSPYPRCSINWAIAAPWVQSLSPNGVGATNESETELSSTGWVTAWSRESSVFLPVACVCGQTKIKCSYLSLLQILQQVIP
jgi:hypothetical protein